MRHLLDFVTTESRQPLVGLGLFQTRAVRHSDVSHFYSPICNSQSFDVFFYLVHISRFLCSCRSLSNWYFFCYSFGFSSFIFLYVLPMNVTTWVLYTLNTIENYIDFTIIIPPYIWRRVFLSKMAKHVSSILVWFKFQIHT